MSCPSRMALHTGHCLWLVILRCGTNLRGCITNFGTIDMASHHQLARVILIWTIPKKTHCLWRAPKLLWPWIKRCWHRVGLFSNKNNTMPVKLWLVWPMKVAPPRSCKKSMKLEWKTLDRPRPLSITVTQPLPRLNDVDRTKFNWDVKWIILVFLIN